MFGDWTYFGVWKAKWRFLKKKRAQYNIQSQFKIVVATMALHNFICESATKDDDFDEDEGMEEQELNPPNPLDVPEIEVTRYESTVDVYMTGVCNSIAESIWAAQ